MSIASRLVIPILVVSPILTWANIAFIVKEGGKTPI